MRRSFRHIPLKETGSRSLQEIRRICECFKALSVPFPLTCFVLRVDHQSSAHSGISLQVDLAGSKYVSARRHGEGHPKSGEKARSIKQVRPKAEIRPHSATETSKTVGVHSKSENSTLSDVISRETAPVRVLWSVASNNPC